MGIAETRSTGQEVASAQTLKQPAGHTNFPDPSVTTRLSFQRVFNRAPSQYRARMRVYLPG